MATSTLKSKVLLLVVFAVFSIYCTITPDFSKALSKASVGSLKTRNESEIQIGYQQHEHKYGQEQKVTGSSSIASVINVNTTGSLKNKNTSEQKQGYKQEQKQKHDFTYDPEKWGSPRIAVLAGPHKTATTTLQSFFVQIAGKTVRLTEQGIVYVSENTKKPIIKMPHPSNTDWVFPLGVSNEYYGNATLAGGSKRMKNRKFYAILASLISGRRINMYFNNWNGKSETEVEKLRFKATNYFRLLFRQPWEEGKKIIIAAEAFDTLVMSLGDESIDVSADISGEELHIASNSSDMIDALLDVFPWDDNNHVNSTNNNTAHVQQQSLRLEDIEVQINYRTPRMSHMVSIWHQLGKKSTLRQFLQAQNSGNKLYQINSLALALQFVRKGIKTTIVDMMGVSEKEASEEEQQSTNETISETVVKGLRGVLACEILQMGNNKNNTDAGLVCDGNSHIHLPLLKKEKPDLNVKKDRSKKELTDLQMEEINRAFEEYDCSVWQHLQKYQTKGLLRILYPSQHLFATCNTTTNNNKPQGGTMTSNTDISFSATVKKVREIVCQEKGIPRDVPRVKSLQYC